MSIIEYLHKRVAIPNPLGGSLYLYLCNITHISSLDGKLYINSITDKPIYINIQIGELYSQFPQPFFDNCHEAHIVNVNFVIGHIPGDGGTLKVKDNSEAGYIDIPVSRTNKNSTKTAIEADTLNLVTLRDEIEKKTAAANKEAQPKKKKSE